MPSCKSKKHNMLCLEWTCNLIGSCNNEAMPFARCVLMESATNIRLADACR